MFRVCFKDTVIATFTYKTDAEMFVKASEQWNADIAKSYRIEKN